jgi:hypothetical protein
MHSKAKEEQRACNACIHVERSPPAAVALQSLMSKLLPVAPSGIRTLHVDPVRFCRVPFASVATPGRQPFAVYPGPLHVEGSKAVALLQLLLIHAVALARHVHGAHHTRQILALHMHGCVVTVFMQGGQQELTADTGHMPKRDQPMKTVCKQVVACDWSSEHPDKHKN